MINALKNYCLFSLLLSGICFGALISPTDGNDINYIYVPFIWKSNVMADGPGVYGDVMRRVYGAGTEGWNFAVGQIQGWGGTEAYRESLVNISMMWMMKEPEPIPNLARSWEWTDDGHTLIMKLVKGHIGLMGTSSRLRMLFFPTTTFWMIKSLVGKPKVLFHLGIKSRNSNR